MELRRLRYFARIAEDGSLTKAAGVLRIAQPALSRQIRLLEEELGVQLFRRTARGMQLTEEGEYLRNAIIGPLRNVELALQNVRSLDARIEGNFAIGMPSSLGDLLGAVLVKRMHDDYPNIRLRIVEGLTGSLIDWLHRGMLDFALLEEASRDERLTDQNLVSLRLMLAGPGSSSLQSSRAVPLEKALQLPLILPTHHLGVRGILNDVLARPRRSVDVRFEADSCRLIKELVVGGMGYAILPLAFFRQEHASGAIRYAPITRPALSLPVILSTRSGERFVGNRVEGIVITAVSRVVQEICVS
ncbi:MAG TPA: LysR family transcriptional regulator [Steroidobacteraceae bacterium]|jgi:DNA-binding transcriptional LysR family regulator|nr:LysR family transcriptional regulator [Steroidobacteraceae bacterium]